VQARPVFRVSLHDGAVIIRKAPSNGDLARLRLPSTAAFAIMDIKAKELELGEALPDDHLRPYVETYRTLQYIGDDVLVTLFAHAGLAKPGLSPTAEALLRCLSPIFPRKLSFVSTK
jgi:hypothetical protein